MKSTFRGSIALIELPFIILKKNETDNGLTKICDLLQNIEIPDDELMFALILKNLSDRQIFIDRKLIEYSIKRIDRSYGKIFEFIYKIDEMSLKKKEPINLKIIKKILGE